MGFLDRFKLGAKIETKTPNFTVTGYTSNNPFTDLIEPEGNYFDQYILYVSKSIDYIANKVASTQLHLVNEKGELEEDNSIWRDLHSFNPYMTFWEARKLREMHLYLTGAAYWYIDREPEVGEKTEYYPLVV